MDDLRSLHGCLLILHRNITSMQRLVDQHFPCAMRAIEQHKHRQAIAKVKLIISFQETSRV